MLKNLSTTVLLAVFTFTAMSQKSETDPNVISGDAGFSKRIFKSQNPPVDKSDVLEVKGLSGTSFSVSNTADGSSNSYKHALRITVGLQMSDNKQGNFELVFYSASEGIPYAVVQQAGVTSIYYPVSTYEGIKEKLEQAFAARRKVQLKVIQKTNGYREGTLLF